ncbi:MAG: hypothetical protein ABIL01_32005 [Pseudomonadota bacterium]
MSRKKSALDEGDDPSQSIPFDYEAYCTGDLLPLVNWLNGKVLTLEGYRKARPSSIQKVDDASSVIIKNLIAAVAVSPRCFLAISLDRGSYTKTRYRPIQLSYDWMVKVLDYLINAKPPLVAFVPGFSDPRSGIGKRTRIKATRHFVSLLKRYGVIVANDPHCKTKNLDRDLNPVPLGVPVVLPVHWSKGLKRHELIRLKNAEGKLVEYQDDELTNGMRDRLNTLNKFIADHFHADLLLTDEKIEKLYSTEAEDAEQRVYSFYSDDRDRPRFVQFNRHQLYRVFNNGSFDEGGRFYGAWWQQIPSKFRPYITINDLPTQEFDYSNLHPAMMYAKEGKKLQDDAYVLPGLKEYRKLVKTTFFKMMNAYEGQRIDPPTAGSLPPNVSWDDLQGMILEKHAAISHRLKSGDGIRLQKMDADIAEDVMLSMMKRDYLALPIHDSFVTYNGLGPIIIEEMKRAYRSRINSEIDVDADVSFLDLELPNQAPEDFDVEGFFRERSDMPGYDGYRARLRQFFGTRTEGWQNRFGFE